MEVVCIGDSLTYGFCVAPADGWVPQVAKALGIHMINRGACGETTADIRRRFSQDVLFEQPDRAFLMGGANDVLLDIPLVAMERNMLAMMDAAAGAKIPLIIGIPPRTKPESSRYGWQAARDVERHNGILAEYHDWLLQLSAERALPYIDFYAAMVDAEAAGAANLYADGVHPTVAGYRLFAQTAITVFDDIPGIIYNE